MRWQYGALVAAIVGGMFAACSGGAEPSEDEGGDFNGPGGGSVPDVTALCETECAGIHAAGEMAYRATRSCLLCDACFVICDAEGVDLSMCPGTMADTCSAQHATCGECVTGACALATDPASGAHTGACAAQQDACSASTDCVAMTNCVSSCVANSPPAM